MGTLPVHVVARALLLVSAASALAACSTSQPDRAQDAAPDSSADSSAGKDSSNRDCRSWERREAGRCVDPALAHQPETRLDMNNVAGDPSQIQMLELPEPPRSGFRLIVPTVELAPEEEREDCFAWAYPEFTHRFVYAARMYTTGGLHHSNMYGVPLSGAGPSPYPACREGQGSVDAQLPNILAGDIMDVLFANSTQVVGGESMLLPEGTAYGLTVDGREVTTGIHYLNASDKARRVEVVYDFFTRPQDEVEHPLVPYYFDNLDFEVPAHTTADVVSDCEIFGGKIVTMMAHTHERTAAVTVELIADDSSPRVLEMGGFDLASDIHVFDTPLDLGNFKRLRQTCTVANDLGTTIDYGIGTDEMCTLFGFMYPPSAQVMGVVQSRKSGCIALNIGENRKNEPR
jgi:hypothetical protein